MPVEVRLILSAQSAKIWGFVSKYKENPSERAFGVRKPMAVRSVGDSLLVLIGEILVL